MVELYPNPRWITVSVFVFALAVCFTGLTATAAAQEISVNDAIEVPEENRQGYTFDTVAVRDVGTNVTVNLNNYDNIREVSLRPYQISGDNIGDNKDPADTVELGLSSEDPGSYWVVLVDEEENSFRQYRPYPVIVSGYDIEINNQPSSVKKSKDITFEVDLTEVPQISGKPYNDIEVALWNDNEKEYLNVNYNEDESSGTTHTYTVTGDPDDLGLDTANYKVTVSAVGREATIVPTVEEKEPLAIKTGDDKISVTESNDGDDGSDNDDDDGGGGGQGGGQGGVGAGGGSEEETNTGPATVQDVRDTVQLVEPDTQSETEIETTSSGQGGPTVEPDEGSSVQRIQFEDESASGSVSITEYGAPPSTVEDEVIESVTNDISNSESSSGDSTSGGDGTNMRVVSLTDISPTTESAEESPATVELTVDGSAVDDPDQLTVVKEGYSFEAQTDKWQQLETSVSDTGDGTITLEAKVDSFSLFAVTETMPSQSSNTDTIEPNSTDQAGATDSTDSGDSDNENTADPTPGFGFITVLVTLLIAAVGSRRIS